MKAFPGYSINDIMSTDYYTLTRVLMGDDTESNSGAEESNGAVSLEDFVRSL